MNTITKIWQWLVYSSVNARLISLTITGVISTAVTFILLAIGIFNFAIPSEQVTGIGSGIVFAFDATLTALTYVVSAFSAWAVVWGLIRKIVLTLGGTNHLR